MQAATNAESGAPVHTITAMSSPPRAKLTATPRSPRVTAAAPAHVPVAAVMYVRTGSTARGAGSASATSNPPRTRPDAIAMPSSPQPCTATDARAWLGRHLPCASSGEGGDHAREASGLRGRYGAPALKRGDELAFVEPKPRQHYGRDKANLHVDRAARSGPCEYGNVGLQAHAPTVPAGARQKAVIHMAKQSGRPPEWEDGRRASRLFRPCRECG